MDCNAPILAVKVRKYPVVIEGCPIGISLYFLWQTAALAMARRCLIHTSLIFEQNTILWGRRTDGRSDAQISHVREYKPVWRMYYSLWATNSVIKYRINKLIYIFKYYSRFYIVNLNLYFHSSHILTEHVLTGTFWDLRSSGMLRSVE